MEFESINLNISIIPKDVDIFILKQMSTIWNQYVDLLTGSKKVTTPDGIREWYQGQEDLEIMGLFNKSSDPKSLMGFASFRNKTDYLYIEQFAIDKLYRGHNLGKRLYNEVEIQAISKNIELEVLNDNIIGMNFFISNGFVFIRRDDDLTGYRMRKKLD
jgi:ribosomal protein S18 acetylase RimI-like enzyme